MLRTDTNRALWGEPALLAPLAGHTLVRAGTHAVTTHTTRDCPVAGSGSGVVAVAELGGLPGPVTVAGCPVCDTNATVDMVGDAFEKVRVTLAQAEDWFGDSVGDDCEAAAFRAAVDPTWVFAGRSLHDSLDEDLNRMLPHGATVGDVEASGWRASLSEYVADRCRALIAEHPDLDPAGIYEGAGDAPVRLVVLSADLATYERAGVFRYAPLLSHDRDQDRPTLAVFELPVDRAEQAAAVSGTTRWGDRWLVGLDRGTYDALTAARQWPGLLAMLARLETGTPAGVRQGLFDAAVAAALT